MPTKKRIVELISIDPGTKNTGVAFWGRRVPGARRIIPLEVYLLTSHETEWMAAAESIRTQLAGLLMNAAYTFEFASTICEQPQYMPGQFATTATGALVKMAHLCGLLGSVAPKFAYVGINEWKGNLPKSIVTERIQKYYEGLAVAEKWKADMWDAVGIGLYRYGEFQ